VGRLPRRDEAKNDAGRKREEKSGGCGQEALGRVLEFEDPASAIVFCRTRVEVDELTDTSTASVVPVDVDGVVWRRFLRLQELPPKARAAAFEFAVTRGALEQNKPVLGICGGQQLLHVVLGGKLIQHIPDVIGHLGHNPEPGVFGDTEIALDAGSLGACSALPMWRWGAGTRAGSGTFVLRR